MYPPGCKLSVPTFGKGLRSAGAFFVSTVVGQRLGDQKGQGRFGDLGLSIKEDGAITIIGEGVSENRTGV